MKGNRLFILFLVILMVASITSFSFAQIKNPDTIIMAEAGGPETMDPHWAYDSASGEVL